MKRKAAWLDRTKNGTPRGIPLNEGAVQLLEASDADDYIIKPFSVPELLIRVRSLLPASQSGSIDSVIRAADIELDRDQCRVTRGKREISLGPTEYRLLEFFMQNPGRVFSREQILDGVWGREAYVDERTVDVHMAGFAKRSILGQRPIRSGP